MTLTLELPAFTPPESTATGAMFWKNMASGWRSLTVLKFLLIRSAQFVGQQLGQCEKTTALTGNGLFSPFEWTGPRSHSSSKKLCFSERFRVKVRCAQCHAKLNPGGAGI